MIPSPAPALQLRPDPDRHPARRLLAPQVRRDRGRQARPHRRDRGRRPEAGDGDRHPPAVAVLLAHRRWPSACRSSAYGLIFSLWLCVARRPHRRRRHLRLGARAAGRSRRPSDHGHDDHASDDGPPPRALASCPQPTPRRRCREGDRARWLSTATPTSSVAEADATPRSRTSSTPPTPASPTPSWRCGCSSASECLLFGGLITTYLLYTAPARQRARRRTRSSTSRSPRSRRSCC